MGRRKGFTLIETLVALVSWSGLGMLIAIPQVRDAFAQNRAERPGQGVVALLRGAGLSQRSGRVSYLHLKGNLMYVTAQPSAESRWRHLLTRDTIGVPVELPDPATASRSRPIRRLIRSRSIRPAWARQADRVAIRFTKGSLKDTIQINPYGRVLK